jgi:hypothetical protein
VKLLQDQSDQMGQANLIPPLKRATALQTKRERLVLTSLACWMHYYQAENRIIRLNICLRPLLVLE